MKQCCNGDCNQGRACPVSTQAKRPRWIRWPVLCTRCGSLSHFAEDCTRMPAGLGMSQHERDLVAMVRRDRRAVLLLAAVLVLAMMIFDILERAPS